MKRSLLCLISIGLWCLYSPSADVSIDPPKSGQGFAPGQVLVKLKEAYSGREIAVSALKEMTSQRSGVEELLPAAASASYLIHLDPALPVPEAIAKLSADPRVELVEPNYVCYGADTIPDDPFFEFMWALNNPGGEFSGTPGADVGVRRAWDLTTGNQSIVVAITDTGIDLSHPDLTANAWTNVHEIPGNGIDDDQNGYVDDLHGWNFLDNNNQLYQSPQVDGHGTHIAGTIGAVGNNGLGISGVSWNVQLMTLKFLDGGENRGFISNAVKAINYAIDQKRKGVDVRVINASWVSPSKSRVLRSAIEAAGEAGILFVCAAGNEGLDIDEEPIYPAAYADAVPTVLPVAALNRFDHLEPYSNYGLRTVSVGAPGTDVLGLAPEGQYTERSGTSMAAAHVSGVAVLLFSSEPALTPSEARERIISTSEPVAELGAYCAGSGRVNAFDALIGRIASPRAPVIGRIETTRNVLTVDGQGFLPQSAIIEFNGVGYSGTRYKTKFLAPNGITLTRLTMKMGRELMKETFPLGIPVAIAVFNTTTAERSNTMYFTRTKANTPE